jgi:hypothetical protein
LAVPVEVELVDELGCPVDGAGRGGHGGLLTVVVSAQRVSPSGQDRSAEGGTLLA